MIIISDKPSKIYARVWKVWKKEKYTDLSISTGDKQEDGTYKNSKWPARLVGKANVEVAEGDSIVITKAKIENVYDKERNREWLRIIAFELEDMAEADNPFDTEKDNEELPF